jgi:hypothetical protein
MVSVSCYGGFSGLRHLAKEFASAFLSFPQNAELMVRWQYIKDLVLLSWLLQKSKRKQE